MSLRASFARRFVLLAVLAVVLGVPLSAQAQLVPCTNSPSGFCVVVSAGTGSGGTPGGTGATGTGTTPTIPGPGFVVTSAADTDGQSCGPDCTLRQAINAANAAPGADVIRFAIGSGAQTIVPTSPLPTITDAVTIDGASQPGYAGTPLIELDGSSAGFSSSALVITAGSSQVRGLAIVNFQNDAIKLRASGGNT